MTAALIDFFVNIKSFIDGTSECIKHGPNMMARLFYVILLDYDLGSIFSFKKSIRIKMVIFLLFLREETTSKTHYFNFSSLTSMIILND